MQHTHLEIVEGRIIGHIRCIADQPIIGDDLDACFIGLGQNVGKRSAVDRCHNQNLGTLGDHVFDLCQLVRYIVFSILKIGLITALLKHFYHVVAVCNPARRRLGWHCYTHKTFVLCLCKAGKGKRGHRDCQC
ncbi:hypothetical protein FQZ97_1072320 [compost metagenome]